MKDKNIKEFEKALVDTYNEMQDNGIFGIKRVFVPIKQIRANVCKHLRIKRNKFDELLKELLSLDNCNIRLHGGPTDAYAKEKKLFEYEGKYWLYLSMNE